jgi:hypothetical protein
MPLLKSRYDVLPARTPRFIEGTMENLNLRAAVLVRDILTAKVTFSVRCEATSNHMRSMSNAIARHGISCMIARCYRARFEMDT